MHHLAASFLYNMCICLAECNNKKVWWNMCRCRLMLGDDSVRERWWTLFSLMSLKIHFIITRGQKVIEFNSFLEYIGYYLIWCGRVRHTSFFFVDVILLKLKGIIKLDGFNYASIIYLYFINWIFMKFMRDHF